MPHLETLSDDHRPLSASPPTPAISAFVTANAGSGKTKTLIDRVARLLLAGSSPRRSCA
jgi:ATP-dependent exoDNAse (exonuclease V) beta subunit